jgi:Ca2+-binding EF-hand superfamily protein
MAAGGLRSAVLAAALLGLGAAGVLAGSAPAHAAEANLIGQADSNGDGTISEQEWMNASKKRFEKLDTNHNGVIDQTELQAARDSLRERFRSRWQQRQGGATGATDTP